MKKKFIAIYIFLILGIAAYDLFLETTVPVEMMDFAFSLFKGIGIGTILMAFLMAGFYIYKRLFTPEQKKKN